MYKLLDSGDGHKLEQFGDVILKRPCSQALWKPALEVWEPHATFDRESGWSGRVPKTWNIEHEGIIFKLKPTDFGHLGVFPEHAGHWEWLCERAKGARVLNLFAYSGGATLALAKAGAEVCHLDASKGMVDWARENAALNQLEDRPVRWIVDDAMKFLRREARRESYYDGIVLDPPSFGRGKQGQVFIIEEHVRELLDLCHAVMSKEPRFMLLSCHTPGMTPLCLRHLLGKGECGEMTIESETGVDLPTGSYARYA